MRNPRTTIDRRYSMPDAQPIGWDDTESLLRESQLSWITTVRADGRPHVTPLVAVWLDGALYVNTGSGEQKYKNLMANPNVVVTTGNATWDRGVDVIVEGTAVAVHDEDELERVAALYREKWDGDSWNYTVQDGRFVQRMPGDEAAVFGSEVFRIEPTKVFAHAKGVFGQTRHLFG